MVSRISELLTDASVKLSTYYQALESQGINTEIAASVVIRNLSLKKKVYDLQKIIYSKFSIAPYFTWKCFYLYTCKNINYVLQDAR
jgi:hypothetical protein